MKLPLSLQFKKKITNQYFLALLLRDEKATAVIFEEAEGKVRVVGEHEEQFATTLEHATIEELLEVLDKAISNSESGLDESIQTQKTVFGVKEEWVEEAKIKKEYLSKLKKISESLSLTPIGFLVIPEAIAHLLSREEGAPVSAILVEIGKKAITVSHIRAGRVIETKTKILEDSPVKTTDALLHSFTKAEIFPARVIIFNTDNQERLVHEFTTHNWSKQLPFLHVPQITTLSKSFDARAVLFGAAGQMGFEVLQADLADAKAVTKKVPLPSFADHAASMDIQEASTAESLEGEAASADSSGESKEEKNDKELQSFGFMKEKDIMEAVPEEDQEIVSEDVNENNSLDEKKEAKIAKESLEEKEPEKKENFTAHHKSDESEEMMHELVQASVHHEKKHKQSLFAPIIVMGNTIMDKIKGLIKPSHSSEKGGKIHKLFIIPPIIIALVIGILLLYVFFIKAVITLNIKVKSVDQNEAVIFAVGGKSDFAKNTIAAESFSVDEDGSVTTDATGKKEVGDSAKGSITLSSALNQQKTIAKGTKVTSSNSLVFVLDNDVSIASSSGLSDIKTAKAAVTANDIGKEYNLPSGTKFTITGFSSSEIEGKNDNAFSGGSKKDVTVVSKEDVAKIEEQLPKDLEAKAKDDMQKKLSGDKALLPVSVSQEITDERFSKKVGDEASSVTLKGTVSFDGVTYKKSELESFGKKLLKDNIGDMLVTKKGITFDIQDVKQNKDKTVTTNTTIKASLLPSVDASKLSQDLAGKSFDETKAILMKLPQVQDVRIVLSPNLPFLPKTLPRMNKNITILRVNND